MSKPLLIFCVKKKKKKKALLLMSIERTNYTLTTGDEAVSMGRKYTFYLI